MFRPNGWHGPRPWPSSQVRSPCPRPPASSLQGRAAAAWTSPLSPWKGSRIWTSCRASDAAPSAAPRVPGSPGSMSAGRRTIAMGAPRLCRPAPHPEPGFKRVAAPEPSGASAWERTPARKWLGNLARLALVQRVYGRLEHRREHGSQPAPRTTWRASEQLFLTGQHLIDRGPHACDSTPCGDRVNERRAAPPRRWTPQEDACAARSRSCARFSAAITAMRSVDVVLPLSRISRIRRSRNATASRSSASSPGLQATL